MVRMPPIYCRPVSLIPLSQRQQCSPSNSLSWWPFSSSRSPRRQRHYLKVCGLYLTLYLFVGSFFTAAMTVFLHGIIMQDYPHRTGADSLMELQPGISLVPQPDYLTTMIRFKMGRKYTYRKFVDDLVAFTQQYEHHTLPQETSLENCAQNQRSPAELNTMVSCRFDLEKGGPCNIYYDFGYSDGVPCVALKLNRVYGWMPGISSHNSTNAAASVSIPVKCSGATEVDEEYMGPLCYYDDDHEVHSRNCPKTEFGEFKHWYFPYLKQSSYQSPLVFVQFMALRRHVTIRVKCFVLEDHDAQATNHSPALRFEMHMF